MNKLVMFFSVLALAAAKPGFVAPLAYSTVPAISSLSQYSTSVAHGSPLVAPALYSAPLHLAYAQAPHSPAIVLDPAHGVPLDTPEVAAARTAHYQAKVLSGHHLGKRSVVAPGLVSTYSAPVVSTYSAPVYSAYSSPLVSQYAAPLVSAYSSPIAYSVAPKAYGIYLGK